MARSTSIEERNRIMEMSAQGFTDPEIASQLHLSPATVRKWRRRGQRGGAQLMVSRMGRPKVNVLGSFPAELSDKVRQLRKEHPGWGPKTLRIELQPAKTGQDRIPSVSSIRRFLKQEGMIEPYQHHTQLPLVSCNTPPVQVHEQWEMDARGHHYVPDIGVIALIHVNDRLSHCRLISYPCYLGEKRARRYPQTADYQLLLRLAFIDWGMPKSIAVDHDSVFFDNDSAAPYPTRFHLWLIALGIGLVFGRKGFPTDQAMTERSHQLWDKQVLKGQRFDHWETLYQALKQRRDFLNYHLPCATLKERPIMEVFPQVRQSSRWYQPEYETDIFDIQRIHDYLSQGKWFRKVSVNGVISLGGQVYNLSRAWAQKEIEIRFDNDHKKLEFINHHKKESQYQALKGCSPQELMGELKPTVRLANAQLWLPFTYKEWRKIKILTV